MTEQNTASYDDLLAERKKIDDQLSEVRTKESSEAVENCKALIQKFGIEPETLYPAFKPGKKTKSEKAGKSNDGSAKKVVAKYRDPATGTTWSGRGKSPLWIKDQDREQFLIKN